MMRIVVLLIGSENRYFCHVSKDEILDDSRKRNTPHLNGQMNIVGHQTEIMDVVSITLDALLQQSVETETVFMAEKHFLTSVSA